MEFLLVGGADLFDLGAALESELARVEEDEEHAALLDDLVVGFLPLTESGHDGQTVGEARGDHAVEEALPFRLGDRGTVGFGGTEEEFAADPWLFVGLRETIVAGGVGN